MCKENAKMMLPNRWKKVGLFDVVSIESTLVDPKKEPYSEMNLIAPDHIQSETGVVLAHVPAKEQHAISGKYLVKKGDVIYSKIRPYLKKACRATEECLCSADMYPFTVLDQMDASYLLHMLLSETFTKYVNTCSARTGIPKINREDLALFQFCLPPLEEQKKIAATLSVWDSAIEKMEKLIDAKESLLTEYGKELFGRTEQKQNENWSAIALSDVLNEHGDKSTGKEEVFSVSVHKGLVNQIEHLGRSFAAKDTSNYNRVHYGDIVYTKSPTGDFPLGIVKQSLIKEDVIVSPLYGVFTPKTFELGSILDFYFSSPINANNYLHPVAQKGAKNTINITNKKFLSAKLRLPIDVKEQKKIAQFVQTTKKEMAVLQEILENYKKQKQGLMQKLLTGQWRVK